MILLNFVFAIVGWVGTVQYAESGKIGLAVIWAGMAAVNTLAVICALLLASL